MALLRIFGFMIYAAVCAAEDLKRREVSLRFSLLFIIFGLIIRLVGNFGVKNLVLSMIPGVVFAAMSVLSRGEIGMGDALYLLTSGMMLNPDEVILLSAGTLIISAFLSLFLIAFCRRKGPEWVRNKGLPFCTIAVCMALRICINGVRGFD